MGAGKGWWRKGWDLEKGGGGRGRSWEKVMEEGMDAGERCWREWS